MNNKDIAIITSGFLPVPATKGGAVENLIINIINKNEKNKKIKLTVFSIYDEQAQEEAKKYKETNFIFIKTPCYIKIIDKITYIFSKNILKKSNSQSYRYIFQRLYYLNKVSKNLKKRDYSKILLENHPTQYLALKWRKNYIKYADRYYYHCHNEFPGEYGCHNIIQKTSKIICVSNYIANQLKKYLNIPTEKFVVLRNAIDEEKFKKEYRTDEIKKIKEKYGINKDDKVLLFTGRIVPEKGVLELISAIEKVKNSKYKLIIVGSSLNQLDAKTKYEELVEKKYEKIKEKIVFTGFIKYEEIGIIYKIADLAIIPSIWNDPAPLTIIESLVCGLPIITTESGGIPEYVNEECAIILKRDNNIVNNLTQSIDFLLENEEKLKSMQEESNRVGKELTVDKYYENFEKIIQK